MSSVNKTILIGNLTRDPELKNLPGGSSVAEFGLATNRKFKAANGEDREEVCFVDCAAFGRQGEVIHQYCKKGKSLYVEGRLRFDSWDDKNGGGKRSKLSVVVENFQFLGGPDDGGEGGDRRPSYDRGAASPNAQQGRQEYRQPAPRGQSPPQQRRAPQQQQTRRQDPPPQENFDDQGSSDFVPNDDMGPLEDRFR
jgi:single-strand DNA-binding protein